MAAKVFGYTLGSIFLALIVYFVVSLFASEAVARIAGGVMGMLGFIYSWVAPD